MFVLGCVDANLVGNLKKRNHLDALITVRAGQSRADFRSTEVLKHLTSKRLECGRECGPTKVFQIRPFLHHTLPHHCTSGTRDSKAGIGKIQQRGGEKLP